MEVHWSLTAFKALKALMFSEFRKSLMFAALAPDGSLNSQSSSSCTLSKVICVKMSALSWKKALTYFPRSPWCLVPSLLMCSCLLSFSLSLQFSFNMFDHPIPRVFQNRFSTQYRCFSVSMLAGPNDRSDVEKGGKSMCCFILNNTFLKAKPWWVMLGGV